MFPLNARLVPSVLAGNAYGCLNEVKFEWVEGGRHSQRGEGVAKLDGRLVPHALRGNPLRYIPYISKGMHSHAARGNESWRVLRHPRDAGNELI